MPDLEYTMEVSSPFNFPLPDGDRMAEIVRDALERELGLVNDSLIQVEVTRVSDDL